MSIKWEEEDKWFCEICGTVYPPDYEKFAVEDLPQEEQKGLNKSGDICRECHNEIEKKISEK